MAQVAGTFRTNDMIGIREDLENVIYNISPTDTPFMSMIGRGKATATKHEWQTDSLASADTSNKQVEGDDAAYATVAPTTRVSNYTQISRKAIIVSGTARAVDTAGRADEFEYQAAKRAKELKRDMESILCQNQDSSAGTVTVARRYRRWRRRRLSGLSLRRHFARRALFRDRHDPSPSRCRLDQKTRRH